MNPRFVHILLRGAIVAAACGSAASLSVQAQTAAPAAEEPPPKFEESFLASAANVETGRAVWQEQCRHCHGNSAYPGKAPKLKPGTYTPDFIYDRVTYGFKGMPPWKAVFSLEQRMAVVAYIKSDSFSP
jgi:mono/diheme cytochrome c family protein